MLSSTNNSFLEWMFISREMLESLDGSLNKSLIWIGVTFFTFKCLLLQLTQPLKCHFNFSFKKMGLLIRLPFRIPSISLISIPYWDAWDSTASPLSPEWMGQGWIQLSQALIIKITYQLSTPTFFLWANLIIFSKKASNLQKIKYKWIVMVFCL